MRTLLALSAALTFAAAPATAATFYEQQICLTWLSVAGHFGPEAEREAYAKRYGDLMDRASKRDDVPQERRSTDEQTAIKVYVDWVTAYTGLTTSDAGKAAQMVTDAMQIAAACIPMVTDEKLDSDLPIELQDLLNGTQQGVGGSPI